jgi:DNA-binding transcriptional regulator/RsmH inhibitor MraZ
MLETPINVCISFHIFHHHMEEILSVDEQGRIVLPAHIRKAMGIRG